MVHPDAPIMNIRRAAIRLGVPQNWLEAEIKAGQLPHLRIGKRVLVDVDTVRQALVERARQEIAANA